MVQAAVSDHSSAPIDERLRAMLGFLEKLTAAPDQIGPADVAALRARGIDDAAILSATRVCFVFSVMDRIADSFDFQVSDARAQKWVARILLGPGYVAGSIPG